MRGHRGQELGGSVDPGVGRADPAEEPAAQPLVASGRVPYLTVAGVYGRSGTVLAEQCDGVGPREIAARIDTEGQKCGAIYADMGRGGERRP